MEDEDDDEEDLEDDEEAAEQDKELSWMPSVEEPLQDGSRSPEEADDKNLGPSSSAPSPVRQELLKPLCVSSFFSGVAQRPRLHFQLRCCVQTASGSGRWKLPSAPRDTSKLVYVFKLGGKIDIGQFSEPLCQGFFWVQEESFFPRPTLTPNNPNGNVT